MNAHPIPARPRYPAFTDLPALPVFEELRAKRQWVAWDYVWKPQKQKWDKPPLNPRTGGFASSTDPRTWGNYDEAAALARKRNLPGVGYVLTDDDDLVGGDLDDCHDEGFAPWAGEIVAMAETYSEFSPSGTGIRFLARRQGGETGVKLDPAHVEIYLNARYLTLTGRQIGSTPSEILPAPRTLALLHARVDRVRAEIEAARAATKPTVRTSSAPTFTIPPRSGRSDDFFRAVNSCALENLHAWVPVIFPSARTSTGVGGYRVASRDLGRDLDEDLSLTSMGIVDFGIHDQGDRRSGKRSAIDIVIEHAGAADAPAAALWLCDRLALDAKALGWGARRTSGGAKQKARHSKDEAGRGRVVASNDGEGSGLDSDWLGGCLRDDRGVPIPNLANAMSALRNAPDLADIFSYDEMLCASVMTREAPEPGGPPGSSVPTRPVTDNDVSRVQEWIQTAGIPRMGKDTTHQAVDQRAQERAFHPVRDWLDGLRWDARERLETWLTNYLGAEPTPYVQGIGTMFLVAMVARIYEPGCKADYMMVLEGPQGARKSTACAILGGAWFSDNLPDVTTGKDVAQHLPGKWLIEIAEMSAMSRAEDNALKAFISRPVERYRPSYGRKEVIQPRQCVFVGTTNKKTYLRDETGGRRYWPVRVGRVDTDALTLDRDQLFAEAVAHFKNGTRWWPDDAFEAQHIQPQQESRYEADAWEEVVESYLLGKSRVTVTEVAQYGLGMDIAKIGTTEQRRVGGALERLGWVRIRDNRGRAFVPQRHDA